MARWESCARADCPIRALWTYQQWLEHYQDHYANDRAVARAVRHATEEQALRMPDNRLFRKRAATRRAREEKGQ